MGLPAIYRCCFFCLFSFLLSFFSFFFLLKIFCFGNNSFMIYFRCVPLFIFIPFIPQPDTIGVRHPARTNSACGAQKNRRQPVFRHPDESRGLVVHDECKEIPAFAGESSPRRKSGSLRFLRGAKRYRLSPV